MIHVLVDLDYVTSTVMENSPDSSVVPIPPRLPFVPPTPLECRPVDQVMVVPYLDRLCVAVFEEGVVQELYLEGEHQTQGVGDIYLGQISRVLPGIQSAFIDLDLERSGFLHISDLLITDQEGHQHIASKNTFAKINSSLCKSPKKLLATRVLDCPRKFLWQVVFWCIYR